MPPELQTQLERVVRLRRDAPPRDDQHGRRHVRPGFVWLVLAGPSNGFPTFEVLPTYLAGSPYPAPAGAGKPTTSATPSRPTEAGLRTAKQYLEDTAYGQGGRRPRPSAARRSRRAASSCTLCCV